MKNKGTDGWRIFKDVVNKDAHQVKTDFDSIMKTRVQDKIDSVRQDVIDRTNDIDRNNDGVMVGNTEDG